MYKQTYVPKLFINNIIIFCTRCKFSFIYDKNVNLFLFMIKNKFIYGMKECQRGLHQVRIILISYEKNNSRREVCTCTYWRH